MPRQPANDASIARGRVLATALLHRRRAAALSAEALARTAGLSVETVRRIERGLVPNPGVFTVAALARALGISVDALVDAGDRSPQQKEQRS